MNPLVLLGLGAVALVALGRGRSKKGKTGNGQLPPPNGNGNGQEPQDQIVDEGEIESEGGSTYQYRVWQTAQGTTKYVGELLLEGNWTSGPMANTLEEVLGALEEMADSMDSEAQFQPGLGACAEAEAGPFDWYAYDEDVNQWQPIGDQLDPLESIKEGRVWCVLPDDEGGYFSRVLDEETGDIVFESSTVSDPNIAASMAYYGIFNPQGPFPWVGFQQQGG